MYANAGDLLLRSFGRGAAEPFLRYCWHAGYLLTKRSFQLAWELFGPELNATSSHRFRTYRPLREGGDVIPLPLVQHLALIQGLQALNADYKYTVIAFSVAASWPTVQAQVTAPTCTPCVAHCMDPSSRLDCSAANNGWHVRQALDCPAAACPMQMSQADLERYTAGHLNPEGEGSLFWNIQGMQDLKPGGKFERKQEQALLRLLH